MKDTLISFETAKLAKEKGFDIQTYSNCWVKTLDGEIIHNSEKENIPEHDRCEQYLMQPSQSLLQKWLREVHEIDVEVSREGAIHRKPEGYCATVYSIEIVRFHWNTGGLYPTYEEALEAGLLEALKLIK